MLPKSDHWVTIGKSERLRIFFEGHLTGIYYCGPTVVRKLHCSPMPFFNSTFDFVLNKKERTSWRFLYAALHKGDDIWERYHELKHTSVHHELVNFCPEWALELHREANIHKISDINYKVRILKEWSNGAKHFYRMMKYYEQTKDFVETVRKFTRIKHVTLCAAIKVSKKTALGFNRFNFDNIPRKALLADNITYRMRREDFEIPDTFDLFLRMLRKTPGHAYIYWTTGQDHRLLEILREPNFNNNRILNFYAMYNREMEQERAERAKLQKEAYGTKYLRTTREISINYKKESIMQDISILNSLDDYCSEGSLMNNCIAGYGAEVVFNPFPDICFIINYNGYRYDARFHKDFLEGNTFSLAEVRGFRNTLAPKELEDFLMKEVEVTATPCGKIKENDDGSKST